MLWKDLGVKQLRVGFSSDDTLVTVPSVATNTRDTNHWWRFTSCKTLGLRLLEWFYQDEQFHFKHFKAETRTLPFSSLHSKLEVTTTMKSCNTPETAWGCGIHCLQTLLENGEAGFVVDTPCPLRVPDFSNHTLTFAFPPLLPTSSSWLLLPHYMVPVFTRAVIVLQADMKDKEKNMEANSGV